MLHFEALEPRCMLAGMAGPDLSLLPSDMVASAYVFIGDHSSSNSEKWDMTIGGQTHSALDYGEVQRDKRDFAKGESYDVAVSHVGSTYATGNEDYDYRAWVDRYANPAWTSGNPIPTGHEFFVTDPQQLFQRRYFSDNGVTNPTLGKYAQLHFPGIDLDIDSDNTGVVESSLNEDVLEADSTEGAYISVLSGDIDGDGIQDNYDFDGIAGAFFSEVKLSLSSNLAYAGATGSNIMLSFDFEDAGYGTSPTNKLFRLWTKDAWEVRSASDLISAGSPIYASSIGLEPGGTVSLYLESVNPTRRTVHFDPISVTAAVTANWVGTLTDKVHARGIEFVSNEPQYTENGSDAGVRQVQVGEVTIKLTVDHYDVDFDPSTMSAEGDPARMKDLMRALAEAASQNGIDGGPVGQHIQLPTLGDIDPDATTQKTSDENVDGVDVKRVEYLVTGGFTIQARVLLPRWVQAEESFKTIQPTQEAIDAQRGVLQAQRPAVNSEDWLTTHANPIFHALPTTTEAEIARKDSIHQQAIARNVTDVEFINSVEAAIDLDQQTKLIQWIEDNTQLRPQEQLPSAEAIEMWKEFYNALKVHEEGHLKIFLEQYANPLKSKLEEILSTRFWGVSSVSEDDARIQAGMALAEARKELDNYHENLRRTVEAAQLDYEVLTNHGESQSEADPDAQNTIIDAGFPLQFPNY